jgi:long-chain fatty acid transport protein
LDLGASLFSPQRSADVGDAPFPELPEGTFLLGSGNYDSSNDIFLIPHFGYNKMVSDTSSIGVSFYGNGGMNTDYGKKSNARQDVPFLFGGLFDPPGTGPNGFGESADDFATGGMFGDGYTGVDLKQAFLNLTYATQLSDSFAVGLSVIGAVQSFEAKGLSNFAPFTKSFNQVLLSGGSVPEAFGAVTDLTDNGTNWSYGGGVKIGFQHKLTDSLTWAASYQSKMWMSDFDDYSDLFAESGGFDIPATATGGLAWQATDTMTFTLDYQHIWYDSIDAISNSQSNLFACPSAGGTDPNACLGGNNGAGFGWENSKIVKIGWVWKPDNLYTYRAGASFANQVISGNDVMFNVLAPAVVQQHYTLGLSRKMGKSNVIDFAVMYAPEETVSGSNPFSGGAQPVEISMYQFEAAINWGWIWE